MIDPEAVLHQLLALAPVRLQHVPTGPGIYALYDHDGRARYIGIASQCLNDRIFKRHVGGDNNSHKFSSIYNAGRMFHTRYHPATCERDGAIAKELRRLFAREHCRAGTISLPGLSKTELCVIENAVLAMAPPEARTWNNARTLEAYDPAPLLSTFLTTLRWPQDKLDAVERQSKRWEKRLVT